MDTTAGAFALVTAVFAVLRWQASRLGARLTARYGLGLRRRVQARLVDASLPALANATSAEIANVLTYNTEIVVQGFSALQQLLVAGVTAAASLAVACWVSPVLVLATPVLGLLGLLGSRAFGREQSEVSRAYVADMTRLFWHSEDFPRRLRHVRSYGREDAEKASYGDVAAQLCEGYARQLELIASGRLLLELAAASGIALVFALAHRWHGIDGSSLMAVCLLLGRLLPLPRVHAAEFPATEVGRAGPGALAALHGAGDRGAGTGAAHGGARCHAAHRAPADQPARGRAPCMRVSTWCRASSTLRLRRLGHRQEQPGRRAGRHGASRCIRRAAGQRCPRLRRLPATRLEQGLRQPERSSLAAHRCASACVGRRPRLTDASLREALADVGLDRRLADTGLDTSLADASSRLSGGELQRLLLAQVILRQPVLAVLDEATSALDAASGAGRADGDEAAPAAHGHGGGLASHRRSRRWPSSASSSAPIARGPRSPVRSAGRARA